MAAFWNQGTITLTTDSAEVAGQGTDFNMSTLRPGDTIESDDGRRATILSINAADGAGAITLDKPWRGPGQAEAPYKAWFTPDDVVLEGLGRRALSNLSSGNISAFAELLLEANKGFHATGEGTLATHDLTALGRTIIGANDTTAARAAIGANDAANLTTGTIPDARVSATLSADKAFRRGNILGTVSQSSGVPTGALFQSGTNANGYWERHASGLQICIRDTGATALTTPNAGNNLWRTDPQGVTFPSQFVSAPYGAIRIAAGNGWMGTINATTTTQWQYTLMNLVQQTAPATTSAMSFFAIGRWF